MNIQALWASHFSASLNELKETFLKLKFSKLTGEGFFWSLILTNYVGENGETASEAEWKELWRLRVVMPLSLPQVSMLGIFSLKADTPGYNGLSALSIACSSLPVFKALWLSFSAGNFADFCLGNTIHKLHWTLSLQKKKLFEWA